MLHGLLIRKEWLELILDGRKVWEIRGSGTSRRGLIALIQSKSGTVTGVCELQDCLGPLPLEELDAGIEKAGGTGRFACLPYARTHAWVLGDARPLARPVRYDHPPGAVIWVRLAAEVERQVLAQIRG